MCAKKRKNRTIVQLSPDHRTALWIYLDLLAFVRASSYPNIDDVSLSVLRDLFDQLDGDPRTLGIELTSRDHRICCIALDFARRFYNGQKNDFIQSLSAEFEKELLAHQAYLPVLCELFGCGSSF